jgi:thiol-disulfide isomerase/thioredoxin
LEFIVKKRRWYLDAILVLVVLVLGALVVMRFTDVFKPAVVVDQPAETEETPTDDNGNQNAVTEEEIAEAVAEDLDEILGLSAEEIVISEDTDEGDSTAPDFTLVDLEGQSVSLSDYLGTPVMVNFWATWCPPCRAEMPLIQDFQDRYADDFVVLAVNGGETAQEVEAFVSEQGFNMVFLLDPEFAVAELFQVRGFPTSIFITAEGVAEKVHIGELNEPLMVSYLSALGISE